MPSWISLKIPKWTKTAMAYQREHIKFYEYVLHWLVSDTGCRLLYSGRIQ